MTYETVALYGGPKDGLIVRVPKGRNFFKIAELEANFIRSDPVDIFDSFVLENYTTYHRTASSLVPLGISALFVHESLLED